MSKSRFDKSSTLGNGRWDEEEHPRGKDGRFVDSGGESGGKGEAVVPVVSKSFFDGFKMNRVYDPVEMDTDVVAKAIEESKTKGDLLVYKGKVVRLTQRPEGGASVILRARGETMYELFNKDSLITESEAKKTMDWDDVEKRFRKRR